MEGGFSEDQRCVGSSAVLNPVCAWMGVQIGLAQTGSRQIVKQCWATAQGLGTSAVKLWASDTILLKIIKLLENYDLQHSMGLDATCKETIRPLDSGMCTRNTNRTRVFFRPISVSPFRNSMSAFLSLRIPAQSML